MPPAMMRRYWRALRAAWERAPSREGAAPWQTVAGCVDSSTRHWCSPLRLSASEGGEEKEGGGGGHSVTLRPPPTPKLSLSPELGHPRVEDWGRSARSWDTAGAGGAHRCRGN